MFYVIDICFMVVYVLMYSIVYAEFLMFSLFYLYIVRNDDNKDDQSINQSLIAFWSIF